MAVITKGPQFLFHFNFESGQAEIILPGDWKCNRTTYGWELYDESSIYILVSFGQGGKARVIIVYMAPDQSGGVWLNRDVPNNELSTVITTALLFRTRGWSLGQPRNENFVSGRLPGHTCIDQPDQPCAVPECAKSKGGQP